MDIRQSQFLSIRQMQDTYLPGNTHAKETGQDVGFADILNGKVGQESPLRFSKHAAGRLEQRNIELSQTQLDRLSEGTQKAVEKGINESLVLVDQLAFIVNTHSKTVITAMEQSEATENIFTNIDGTVII